MANHIEHREPATPEEIWNILRELSESQKETDRRMQETDLRLRKLDELFNGQWGKLMESLVEGDLVKLLRQRGIAVDHTISNPKKNYGERRWEFDILAVNGDRQQREHHQRGRLHAAQLRWPQRRPQSSVAATVCSVLGYSVGLTWASQEVHLDGTLSPRRSTRRSPTPAGRSATVPARTAAGSRAAPRWRPPPGWCRAGPAPRPCLPSSAARS